MRVNEWLGYAEFGGDIIKRGAGEAVLVEEFNCFFEDSLPFVGQDFISHAAGIRLNGLD
jgi:hypothetical protein